MKNHYAFFSALLLAGCGEVVSPGASGADAAPAPSATTVSPDHGPFGGGIDVTIPGGGFSNSEAGDAAVLVGGVVSRSVTVDGDDSVTFELPPGIQEGATVDVTVFNQNGLVTLPDAFTYNPVPIALSISPVLTRRAGGTNITITGRGFDALEAGTPTVKINGVAAIGVTVVDDTTITAVTEADALAQPLVAQDLEITNANGTAVLEDAVRLTAPGLLAMGSGGNQGGSGLVYYVDINTGVVTSFTRLNSRVHECATNASGTVFGVTGSSGTPHHLTTVNLLTGLVTDIGEVKTGGGVSERVVGLAFVGANLFGITYPEQRLAQINTTTAVSTAVNAAGTAIGRGSGIALKDGTSVYFMDNLNQTLDTIPVATGVVTAGPSVAGTSSNSVGAVTVIGSTVYVNERFSPYRVFSVNTTTGLLTPVATLPSNVDGLCPTPPTF